MRSHLRTVIVLALAVGLVALFLRNVDLWRVGGDIVRAQPEWLALSLTTMIVNLAIRAFRWQYLLEPLGQTSFSSAFRAPRSLNEPVRWKLSSLQKTRTPVISLSGIDSAQGVTHTPLAMRCWAARMSARVTDMAGACAHSRRRVNKKVAERNSVAEGDRGARPSLSWLT